MSNGTIAHALELVKTALPNPGNGNTYTYSYITSTLPAEYLTYSNLVPAFGVYYTPDSAGTIVDVALATDEADSRWLGDSTVSPAAAANENIPPLHAVRKAA